MRKTDIFSKNIANIFKYLIFKVKKYHTIYNLREQISLEVLINKYKANYENIIIPFKEALYLTKYTGNPILEGGKSGEWDETGIFQPFLFYNGQKYFLYYESERLSKARNWQIGLATAEKITGPWKKHPDNPILKYTGNEGDFDKVCIADPAVVKYNNRYHMFFDMFDGKTWRIGKAYSDNGIKWEKLRKNGRTAIILDIGGKNQWDNKMIHCPEVYLWNNKLHMLYGAQGTGHIDFDTGLAIQVDENGDKFEKWGQVTADDMFENSVTVSRLQAGFIINGIIISALRIIQRDNNDTVYMVFSDDGGKSWNKLSGPILKPGKKNEWDSKLFYGLNTWIISENKLWTAYLGGKRSDLRSVGLASMNIPKIL
ncbi:MAG: hypothetical protein ACFFHV_07845 [Promethearchaeota archaeon]